MKESYSSQAKKLQMTLTLIMRNPMENKQTALEWLVQEIESKYLKTNGAYDVKVIIGKDIVDKAKAMERDQIIDAHDAAYIAMNLAFRGFDRSLEYYEATYGS